MGPSVLFAASLAVFLCITGISKSLAGRIHRDVPWEPRYPPKKMWPPRPGDEARKPEELRESDVDISSSGSPGRLFDTALTRWQPKEGGPPPGKRSIASSFEGPYNYEKGEMAHKSYE